MSFNYPNTPPKLSTPIQRMVKRRVLSCIIKRPESPPDKLPHGSQLRPEYSYIVQYALDAVAYREPYSWTVLQQELDVIKQRRGTQAILANADQQPDGTIRARWLRTDSDWKMMTEAADAALQRQANFEEAERSAYVDGATISADTRPAWCTLNAAELIAKMKEAISQIPQPLAPVILPPYLYDEAKAAGLLPNNCVRGPGKLAPWPPDPYQSARERLHQMPTTTQQIAISPVVYDYAQALGWPLDGFCRRAEESVSWTRCWHEAKVLMQVTGHAIPNSKLWNLWIKFCPQRADSKQQS